MRAKLQKIKANRLFYHPWLCLMHKIKPNKFVLLVPVQMHSRCVTLNLWIISMLAISNMPFQLIKLYALHKCSKVCLSKKIKNYLKVTSKTTFCQPPKFKPRKNKTQKQSANSRSMKKMIYNRLTKTIWLKVKFKTMNQPLKRQIVASTWTNNQQTQPAIILKMKFKITHQLS